MTFKITNELKFNNDHFKFNSDFKYHITFEITSLYHYSFLILIILANNHTSLFFFFFFFDVTKCCDDLRILLTLFENEILHKN
jgi:hypothetical protein